MSFLLAACVTLLQLVLAPASPAAGMRTAAPATWPAAAMAAPAGAATGAAAVVVRAVARHPALAPERAPSRARLASASGSGAPPTLRPASSRSTSPWHPAVDVRVPTAALGTGAARTHHAATAHRVAALGALRPYDPTAPPRPG